MLKEFVEAIAGLVHKSVKPEPIVALTTFREVAFAMPDGTIMKKDRELPDRLARVASLIEMAKVSDYIDRIGNNEREVFIDQEGAKMLIRTAGGFDRLFCPFVMSDAWKTLIEMDAGAGYSFDQKQLLRKGRFILRMTPTQLEPFRKLDFSAAQSVVGDVRKTSESLGRTINSAVVSDKPIPDTIELNVPIFTTPGEDQTYPVQLDVEISTADQRILLKPLPGELDRCMTRHLDGARDRLLKVLDPSNNAVPVYLGTCWS